MTFRVTQVRISAAEELCYLRQFPYPLCVCFLQLENESDVPFLIVRIKRKKDVKCPLADMQKEAPQQMVGMSIEHVQAWYFHQRITHAYSSLSRMIMLLGFSKNFW